MFVNGPVETRANVRGAQMRVRPPVDRQHFGPREILNESRPAPSYTGDCREEDAERMLLGIIKFSS